MPNFASRSAEAELMDDLTLASEALRQNLDELEVINTRLGGYGVITHALAGLQPQFAPERPVQIVDVGSGGGDTLRHVARWARSRGLPVALIGVDANAFMVEYAAGRSAQYPEIHYVQQNIFAPDFAALRPDIIMCSLFCHHFDDEQLTQMLRQWQQQARVAVVINDLHRHPLAYHSIRWLTRLLGGSYLVQNDAPLSVLRGFQRHDWQRLLSRAGVQNYQLRWRWAFRWQLILAGQA
ncbi:methyltransferase domain-containing protein [Hymenobacter sp. CRA2]|uniref:methyltransferase domain-containing protein n=1 Tax=Hymenobacter sp. CRA2 TaxID=1955620 RepID=UPI00098FBF3F|nr:methyltransferase domain-containing protein [Hymenobacter sp. CRA2]OON67827.1 SAM-dependent methyltransferase [Hymenobacter sp. CRA2]